MPQRFSYSSSLSALTIVLVSLAPVLLLHGIIARSPAGSLGEPFCPTEEGVEWALRAAR